VDSADAASWSDRSLEIEERARRHGRFESWIVDHVVPWMSGHCGGLAEFAVAGCSMGAYHAANLTLKRADLFPLALCLSGNYDPASWDAWGEPGPQTYFNSPLSYLAHAHGDHLDWLRRRASLVLVVGRGAWEQNPTRALPSTLAFAECLAGKQLRYELDVWGEDSPHDWPSWRRQFAHHLARFC
jgi:esterase/lipase superfamily enzyme